MRYPLQLNTATADSVHFTHFPYQNNHGKGKTKGSANPPPSGAGAIQLYMPANTPNMGNRNNWGEAAFEGPLGEIKRDIGMFAADSVMDANFSSMEQAGQSANKAVQSFKEQFKDTNIGKIGNAGKQFALDAISGPLGFDGGVNQMLALSRGEIYNPNVELLYKGPALRSFSFVYQFVPKSAAEAAMVNKIIKEFKMYSAPSDKGMMYEVPHLWQVTYRIGGSENTKLNKFKRAALTKVSLEANNGLAMHASFSDGQPVTYTMQLSFEEVDVVTREDHASAGEVGY